MTAAATEPAWPATVVRTFTRHYRELDDGSVEEFEPPATPAEPLAEVGARLIPGGSFTLDVSDDVPAVWGDNDHVGWAEGESLMLVGPQGVGKSTVAQQLALARVGLTGAVLGMTVSVGQRRVLYLACDRPAQIRRSFHRMVRPNDRRALDERLIVWPGPPPVDFAKDPQALVNMARSADADTVIVDSLKDVALKLSDDEVGAAYNRCRQTALAAGIQLLELHHQVKRGAGGVGKPNTLADVFGSVWLTGGAGSVVLLWGKPGDPVVELLHLKQPAESIGPLDVVHDHQAGTSTVTDDRDPLTLLRAADKLTAGQLARHLYIPDGTRQPTRPEVERARRILDGLHRKGHADKHPQRADDGGVLETVYHWRPRRSPTPHDPLTHDPADEDPT